MEEWKPIRGYEGLYEVSNIGNIRRVGFGRLRTCSRIGPIKTRKTGRAGYWYVNLCRDGITKTFLVHIIVAKAFLGDAPFGMEVNHKNGNKDDLSVGNFEYLTHANNRKHAQEVLGLYRGERQALSKLTSDKVQTIRRMAVGHTQQEIATMFGVTQASVSNIINRKTWGWVS